MAPIAIDDQVDVREKSTKTPQQTVRLQSTGSLDKFTWDDVTPVIGREFIDTNIVDDILNQPNADQLLRDLAITSKCDLNVKRMCSYVSPVSQRGVVFFRKQDNLTDDIQKQFIQRLGEVWKELT